MIDERVIIRDWEDCQTLAERLGLRVIRRNEWIAISPGEGMIQRCGYVQNAVLGRQATVSSVLGWLHGWMAHHSHETLRGDKVRK